MRYLLIFTLFFSIPAFAQFETRQSTPKSTTKGVKKGEIDFRMLHCATDLSELVGDELYFPYRNKKSDGSLDATLCFENMYVAAPKIASSKIHYKEAPDARYPDKTDLFTTPYSAVENKFFKIVSIKDTLTEGNGYFCRFLIRLQDAEGEVFTWMIFTKELNLFDAYFKSYMVKRKNDHVGKFFYLEKYDEKGEKIFFDHSNMTAYRAKKDMKYECVDLTFANKNINKGVCIPYFVFKDPTGKEFSVCAVPTGIDRNERTDFDDLMPEAVYLARKEKKEQEEKEIQAVKAAKDAAFDKEKAERLQMLIKKFGKVNGPIIAEGRVIIGFGKEACKEAWGEPSRVTQQKYAAKLHETWYFDGIGYMTFTNGILDAFSINTRE